MAVRDHTGQYTRFENLRDADFEKQSFGERKFTDLAAKLRDSYRMISEIITVLDASANGGDLTLFRTYISKVVGYVDRFVAVTDPIVNASLDRAQGQIEQWIQSIRADADEFVQRVYGSVSGNYPEADLRATYAAIVSIRIQTEPLDLSENSEPVKRLLKLIGEAETARDAMKNAAGASAAHDLGAFYEQEASRNSAAKDGTARRWLVAGFSFLGVFIALIIVMGINPTAPLFCVRPASCAPAEGLELLISHLVQKVLLLSALAFVARYSFRQYAIRMHTSSAYQQKAILAKTFERLLNTPRTQDRIDLIVTEVMTALSAFVPTGFIRKDEPELHPLAEIANLVSALKSKSKSE